MTRSFAVGLAVGALLATTEVAHAAGDGAEIWWRGRGNPCPKGTRLKGAPPPRGSDVACVKKRSGVFHGPRTTWFDRCSKAKPCNRRKARMRFQGTYRRGIEHGHFIFWHKSGRKGLEGEYFAGKKSGTWVRWDRKGKRSTIEYEDHRGAEDADNAILAALAAAKKVGDQDLARELDDASKDLERGGSASSGSSNSRGGGASESIDATANVNSVADDVPDVDMGGTSFDDGGSDAPPYVRKAIRRATAGVAQCYGQVRRSNPRLSGEIVARFSIAPDGSVPAVAVVKSTMTESMNQCVKRVLLRTRFESHDEGPAVEVISPWRFEAPR